MKKSHNQKLLKRSPSIPYLRKKADKLMQELGRKMYQKCEACGAPMVCIHHYWPKSMAAILRYDWENLIPICNGCHVRHHCGDPKVHARIVEKRGIAWHKTLEKKKEQTIKASKGYYREIINHLQNASR